MAVDEFWLILSFCSLSELWLAKVCRTGNLTPHVYLLSIFLGNIKTTIKLGRLFQLQLYPNCRFWLTSLAEGTPLLKLWWRSLMAGCTFGFQKTNIWWSIFERLRKTSVNYKNISTCQYVEIQYVACTCYVLHIGLYYMSYDMTMT